MASTISIKPASSAWVIFNDQPFSFETLQALGYTPYGGADGDVSSTLVRFPDGGEAVWYSEWSPNGFAPMSLHDRTVGVGDGLPVEAFGHSGFWGRRCGRSLPPTGGYVPPRPSIERLPTISQGIWMFVPPPTSVTAANLTVEEP
jgi:hypothetical protein